MLAKLDGQLLRYIAANVLVIRVKATVTGQNPYPVFVLIPPIVSQPVKREEKSRIQAIKRS